MTESQAKRNTDSELGIINQERNSTRQPSLPRETATTLQRVNQRNTGRFESWSSPRNVSPHRSRSRSRRNSETGDVPQSQRHGHTRRTSAASVEYVPRREDHPQSRRVVAVIIEDDGSSPEEFTFHPVYFETKEQRRRFVRIVYAILGIMLTVDFSLVAIAYFVEPVKNFVQENLAVYIVAFVVFMVVYLCLACIAKLREKTPINYIMLSILCLSMGYLMACITAYHDIQTILFAVAGTLFVVICVTMFAMFCPCDMTGWGLYLCVAGMGLLAVAAVVMIVCLLGLCGQKAWIVSLVISCLFVVLFSFYLAYDTQLILGGKRFAMRPDEYVNGAMHLWIDIVYIFLCMLTIGRITTG